MANTEPRVRHIDGDEIDAHSRRSRPLLHWQRGELAAIKRRTNKRSRRARAADTAARLAEYRH